MAGKPTMESTARPAHPGSLAATSRAARDLWANLHGILEWFDAIRSIDRDAPPTPQPTWWDGYVSDPEWTDPHRTPPNRHHRQAWARKKTLDAIDVVVKKWTLFTEPISMTASERPL